METFTFHPAINRINYLDLSIYFYGFAKLDHQWHGDKCALPANRLYIPKSGEAEISVGQQNVTMRPGYAYLVPADAPMDFHCDGQMEKLYFHFNIFRPDRYDVLSGLKEIYQIPFPADRYERLFQHGQIGSMGDTMMIKAAIYDMLSQFQKRYQIINEEVPKYSKIVLSAITYIQENLSAGLHLEDLAKHTFVARSTLADVFRKEVGVSLGKYIDDQLIASAQRQLSQTGNSIGQISANLGYSNQCYFSRRFKQMSGVTPQAYRTRNKV